MIILSNQTWRFETASGFELNFACGSLQHDLLQIFQVSAEQDKGLPLYVK